MVILWFRVFGRKPKVTLVSSCLQNIPSFLAPVFFSFSIFSNLILVSI